MGFWDIVASAGPYANNLHLAPDITTPEPHHSIFTGRLPPSQQHPSTGGIDTILNGSLIYMLLAKL